VATLWVVQPWSDPPRLIPATFTGNVIGCIAGMVSRGAPVIVQGEGAEDLAERLRAAGYRSVVVREEDKEQEIR
jgi:hypothetical protein